MSVCDYLLLGYRETHKICFCSSECAFSLQTSRAGWDNCCFGKYCFYLTRLQLNKLDHKAGGGRLDCLETMLQTIYMSCCSRGCKSEQSPIRATDKALDTFKMMFPHKERVFLTETTEHTQSWVYLKICSLFSKSMSSTMLLVRFAANGCMNNAYMIVVY